MFAADTTGSDVVVALITMFGAVCVVTVPILLRQHHLQRQLTLGQETTHAKVDDLIAHVNSVEESEAVPDDGVPPTLGQAVREIRDAVRDGFAENTVDHNRIESHLESVQTTVSANTHRITQVEQHIDHLHPDDEPEKRKP